MAPPRSSPGRRLPARPSALPEASVFQPMDDSRCASPSMQAWRRRSLLPDGVFRHALRPCRKLRFSNRWSNPRKALLSCKHDGELSEALTAVLDYYVGIIIPGGFICQIFCVEFCVTKLRRNCMHHIPKKHRQPAPHLRGTRLPSMSPIIN